MTETHDLIIKNLLNDEEYYRFIVNHLKTEYFSEWPEHKVILEIVKEHTVTFNRQPTKAVIEITLKQFPNISEQTYSNTGKLLEKMYQDYEPQDFDWLCETTEKFCQEKSVYNAIKESIQILDGKSKSSPHAIPKILQDALAVNFDTSIGHDFLDDSDSRYDFYHQAMDKIPFDIDILNTVTKGGFPKKTLNIIVAPTGVGKTLYKCHMAANNLIQGKNVLYITMEMSQERIAERIDQNLMDIDQEHLIMLSKDRYRQKMDMIKSKVTGKLIIKEYPTCGAGSSNFRYLLDELKIKKGFVPDLIYVDYLNICASSRIKMTGETYQYVKAVAEELRSLAVERNVCIITSTQGNREANDASDYGIREISDSIGTAMTADFIMALISTDELRQNSIHRVKILKNRYNTKGIKPFAIGVNESKMRLYNVTQQP